MTGGQVNLKDMEQIILIQIGKVLIKLFSLLIIMVLILSQKIFATTNYNNLFKKGVLYLKKDIDVKKGAYTNALKLFNIIPKTNKFYFMAQGNIGIIYHNLASRSYNLEFKKKAEKIFENILKSYRKKDYFYYDIMKMLGVVSQNLDQAYKYLTKYKEYMDRIKKEPDNVFYYNYGEVLVSLGKYKRAKKYLERAIKLNPNNAKAYYELAIVMIKLKEFDKARYYYNLAYNKNFLNGEINVSYGYFLLTYDKNEKGKELIIYGLKDKNYFNVKKNDIRKILRLLSISEIFEVYDYHYPKVKAFVLTLYILLFYKYTIILYSILLFIILIMIYVFRKKLRFNIRYLVKK